MKLFKKLPDLWGNNNCANVQPQPVPNYAPAAAPVEYGPAPVLPAPGGYEPPNPAYNGPGDGDAGYVVPSAPAPPAPVYEAPAPAPVYEEPAPVEPVAPAPVPDSYSQVDDDYGPAAKTYGSQQLPQIVYQPIIYLTAGSPGARTEIPAKQTEPIIETPTEAPLIEEPSTTPAPISTTTAMPIELPATTPAPAPVPAPVPTAAPAAAPAPCNAPACGGYLPILSLPFYGYPAPVPPPPAPAQAPVYAAPPAPTVPAPLPAPAPVYAAPPAAPPATPSYYAPPPSPPSIYAAPAPPPPPPASYYAPPTRPAPSPYYEAPSCQTPIRLSLIDQPYRVAPELFQEYNYRLSLADWNGAR